MHFRRGHGLKQHSKNSLPAEKVPFQEQILTFALQTSDIIGDVVIVDDEVTCAHVETLFGKCCRKCQMRFALLKRTVFLLFYYKTNLLEVLHVLFQFCRIEATDQRLCVAITTNACGRKSLSRVRTQKRRTDDFHSVQVRKFLAPIAVLFELVGEEPLLDKNQYTVARVSITVQLQIVHEPLQQHTIALHELSAFVRCGSGDF